ncbi:dihydrolipoyl dehydrogenase [Thalassotalea mangrovi]|uniref:Dihydrolipoyl dehydrogenase n=1 Tax=Thalassotalea mangrovi TaxID=2572245 RepID=A0A4U1B4R9_9GAMM|nr:dihydrolipoyl dehydrogenase [Thalassotalea mangrovi]TKB45309.1 dihydrolipoyl dehydrogenase [Thalassotalea mangrovi]
MAKQSDVLIIGGGPGGYTAAIRAAQLGLSVTLVEKEKLGGVCLNWGCIPTKALLHAADNLREIRQADVFGIEVNEPKIDLAKMIGYSRNVAAKLNQGITYLMNKNTVDVVYGEARFIDAHTVQVDDQQFSARHFIIATGARARCLPNLQFDGKQVWSARHALTPTEIPGRLLVVGAGAIGVEFASFYNALGTKVTLVETQSQLLPAEDKSIADCVQDAFTKQGIEVYTESVLANVRTGANSVTVQINEQTQEFDAVLLSVGVIANTEQLNLPAAGVNVSQGFINTNATMQSEVAHIYAIGDVAGAPCLAHKASHEAILAVEHIAGLPVHAVNHQQIPRCTYSHPQVASVGLTEAQASEIADIRVGTFPLSANGKAIAINHTDGFVKTIFDKHTGELYGAHMVGSNVTEMLQGYVASMALEATDEELSKMIIAHPTVSEAMHESVLASMAKAINM